MQGQNNIPERKKRNRTWPVKLSEEEIATLEEIKSATDRPIGYLIREFMLRGLAAFRRDGLLKEPVALARQAEKPATISVPTGETGKGKAGKRNTA